MPYAPDAVAVWRTPHHVDGDYPMGGPGKTIEADETFIGGRFPYVKP